MDIVIQPGYSTDIHLFTTGPAAGLSAYVPIALLDPATKADVVTTATHKQLLQDKVTYDTPDNEVATTQTLVTFEVQSDPGSNKLLRLVFKVATGAQPGQTYCRVAYGTEGAADYSNVIFRVSVHTSLQRFWPGQRRLTLFNKSSQAELDKQNNARELAVFGECLDVSGKPPRLVDLSGNSYLTYKPTVAGIKCSASGLVQATFATVTPVAQLKGYVSVEVGTMTASALPGGTGVPRVEVWVKADGTVVRKTLRRFHTGTATDPARKLKLLVLTDGFTSQAEVKPWLDKLKEQLLSNNLHTPFDKLRENIDLWTADLPFEGLTPGVTVKSPLNKDGYMVPAHPIDRQTIGGRSVKVDGQPGMYTMRELLGRIGLPTADEPTLADATTAWQTKFASGMPNQNGFDPAKVSPDLYSAWLEQQPAMFVLPNSTTLDVVKGTQQLRAASDRRVTRGDWAVGKDGPIFPRLGNNRENAGLMYEVLASLRSPDGKTKGSDWRYDAPDKLQAGMICLIVKDQTRGAATRSAILKLKNQPAALFPVAAFFSTGKEDVYTPVGTGPLVTLSQKVDTYSPALATEMTASFVHELGHLLGLEDEYGNGYSRPHGNKAPLTTADEPTDVCANVATAQQLISAGIAPGLANTPATDPTTGKQGQVVSGVVAKPAAIKWNWDRLTLAATLLAPPQASGGALLLKVEVEASQDWKAQEGKKALVRARTLSTVAIDPARLYPVEITQVTKPQPGPAEKPYYLLRVTGALPGIGKEDVIYVPRYYPAVGTTPGAKMQLIASKVADLMHTVTFKLTDDIVDCAAAAARDNVTQYPVAGTTKRGIKVDFVQAMKDDLLLQGSTNSVQASENIIGLYEGGGEYDCAAYRSNGQSKMRLSKTANPAAAGTSVAVPHNYVCQYYLLNKINPNKLADLDKTYDAKAY